jgi:hypothetical protein
MKFFISILLIALLSFAACLYLPWWVIAITSGIVAFAIPQKTGLAFLAGFLALFILWVALSFYISSANGHLLAHKMSILFVKADNNLLLFLLTGFIGGVVGGFGSLSGRLLKKLFVEK